LENDRLNVIKAGPMPIGDLLVYYASKDPRRPAVTYNEVAVSYAELDARSSRKAAGFGFPEEPGA
jgi:non-ribosomal peptide synthetase component E (peptide arylation enzyme)